MLSKYNNSWSFSIPNPMIRQYEHHYICTCSKNFIVQTEIDDPYAPDILCPKCGNDYFKDSIAFENMSSTRFWKDFQWISTTSEDKNCWYITISYDAPIYCYDTQSLKIEEKKLLSIYLKKDGSESYKISHASKIVFRYSLYLDDKIQSFYTLIFDEAKETLYNYIIKNKNIKIDWMDDKEIAYLPVDNKLQRIAFFLKNSHLKEQRFFLWKMKKIQHYTKQYRTQVEMLDYIANARKEKSIKRELYQCYEDSLNNIGCYYPYSDYIFSRTIENIDLLIKLYKLHPAIKVHIFTDETFSGAIEFILFLKRHYSEKQIVKFFVEYIQDVKEYKSRLNHWRDTLRMLTRVNALEDLEEHFSKVKLTARKLHDELVRVFHIVSYKLDAKENFKYDKKYLYACKRFGDLDFRLPSTVEELSFWSKILHNCMFGYSSKIHAHESIIYGVFRAEELLYAIELNGLKIVQAKAAFNKDIVDEDMNIIRSWQHLI